MTEWLAYPVFLASGISICGLTTMAVRNHDATQPRSLSELAAAEQRLLVRFRGILLVCGSLFAVTIYGYVPRTTIEPLVVLAGALMVCGELTAAILPARHKTLTLHTIMAQVMALGMLGLAIAFLWDLRDVYRIVDMFLVILMACTAALTFLDKRRFIIHELIFIFASHISIMLAVLGVH